jgi:hypothetical protein
LTPRSLLLKNLGNNRKGFSTVVATIFMVLAVMFLFFNVFMFVQSQNNRLQDAISQSTQMDADRLLENISTTASLITSPVPGSPTLVTFQCIFRNNCSLPVEIVRMDWRVNGLNVQTTSVTIVVQPGSFNYNILAGTSFASRTVSVFEANSQVIALVTSRGNVILARV